LGSWREKRTCGERPLLSLFFFFFFFFFVDFAAAAVATQVGLFTVLVLGCGVVSRGFL
jgi:hypothetical protein